MSDPCEFKKEIMEFQSNMSKVNANIEHVMEYIRSGARYRLAVICSCIALVGSFLGAWVKFSVNDYRLGVAETNVEEVRKELYDLNYVKGKEVGLAENKR